MKNNSMRGFMLVELMVVICIMAVVTGFTSIGKDMIARERVAGATRELYADIQRARLDAMTQQGKGFGIRFVSHNSYVIFKFNDCNGDYTYDAEGCEGNSREETEVQTRTLPVTVQLHKTNSKTDVNNDVRIFDRFGQPRLQNWGLGMITIVVKSTPDSGLTKCVSISANRIREANWNGSACI